MHLLSVNIDFRYDPIYALGVVTSFERFMQGYQPEQDKGSIFAALCQSAGGNPEQYRREAENILNTAKQLSMQELIDKTIAPPEGGDPLWGTLTAIANNPKFKYSRLFTIGLYTLLAETDAELVKDKEKRDRVFQQVSEALHLSPEKLQKDLDLYRSNLDKIEQLLGVIEEALQAERKKREKSEQETQPKEETNANNSTN